MDEPTFPASQPIAALFVRNPIRQERAVLGCAPLDPPRFNGHASGRGSGA